MIWLYYEQRDIASWDEGDNMGLQVVTRKKNIF